MLLQSENVMFLLSILVQVIGLFGVIAARICPSKRVGRQFNILALTCFAIVGVISSLFILRACTGGWLAFATTMPLMAVGATLDFTKSKPTGF